MEGLDLTDMSRFEDFKIINKVYKTVNGHAIDLDILYPKTLSAPRPSDSASPVLLRFHGGGLVTGSSLFPLFFAPWLLQLIQRHSAVVVSPNYRLIPESTVQDSIDDANDALRWIHQELAAVMLDEAGIRVDVGRIMTAGDSAGGYLSLQVGLSHPDQIRAVTAAYPMADMQSPYFVGQYTKQVFMSPEIPKETISAQLQDVERRETKSLISSDPLLERGALMFGLIQHGLFGDLFPANQRGLFPLLRIEDGARFPRGGLLVWHGKEDTVVPAEGSLKLREAVSKYDPDLDFRLVMREGEHGFDQTASIDDPWVVEAMKEGPRFVTSAGEHVVAGWRDLVTSLKLKRDMSLAIDPTGNRPLLQGPLYVGCSVKLQTQSKAYDSPDGQKTKLDGVNRACAMVTSLMMFQGKEPVDVCRCGTRRWNSMELPIAEILVAALGNSYVSQDGFNRTVCGGESGRPRAKRTAGAKSPRLPPAAQAVEDEDDEDGGFLYAAAEEYVKGRERYLYENSFASVEEFRKGHAFVKEFCHLEPLFAPPGDNIIDDLNELGQELETVQGTADEARYWVERAEKAIKAREAQIKVLREDLEIARLVAELAHLLRG